MKGFVHYAINMEWTPFQSMGGDFDEPGSFICIVSIIIIIIQTLFVSKKQIFVLSLIFHFSPFPFHIFMQALNEIFTLSQTQMTSRQIGFGYD